MRCRTVPRMTRARSHASAVGISPLVQPLLEAVLCVVMSLVQGVRATFGMRKWIGKRDWHTRSATSALPQTKPDIHIEEDTAPTESGSALCRESLLAPPAGLTNNPLEPLNQGSRNKSETDTCEVVAPAGALEACPLARLPGGGRGPVSAQGALPTRTPTTVIPAEARQREVLGPRTYARRRLRLPSLGAGTRSRASGMTPSVCVQISPI